MFTTNSNKVILTIVEAEKVAFSPMNRGGGGMLLINYSF